MVVLLAGLVSPHGFAASPVPHEKGVQTATFGLGDDASVEVG
jgi:hypothetical protein